MLKALGPQRQPIELCEERVLDWNLIRRVLGKGRQCRAEYGMPSDQFEVQPEQNGPGLHGDRMVGTRERNLRVEW